MPRHCHDIGPCLVLVVPFARPPEGHQDRRAELSHTEEADTREREGGSPEMYVKMPGSIWVMRRGGDGGGGGGYTKEKLYRMTTG